MLDFRGSGFITGDHIRVFVARSGFLQERRHQPDISVCYTEGAKRGFHQTIERTGHETVGLAEHLDTVAAFVGERLNPDAVLLVRTCRPGMLFAELIGPGDALIARTESEGALAAVTADNIGEGVGLRAKDRRVGAVLIAELRINGDAVHLDVAVIVRSARVTTRSGQVNVTRDEPLTNAMSVGKVRSLLDTAACDHVSINDLVLCRLIGHRGEARCSLSRLCGHGTVETASGEARRHAGHQSQGQSS